MPKWTFWKIVFEIWKHQCLFFMFSWLRFIWRAFDVIVVVQYLTLLKDSVEEIAYRKMKIKNCIFTVQVLSSWTFGQVKSCFWKAAGKNSRKKLSIPAVAALCTTETRLLSWGQLHTNVTWVMEFSDVYFGLHIISKQIPFMHHHNPLSIINSQQK